MPGKVPAIRYSHGVPEQWTEAEIAAAHAAGLPHPPHPDPLIEDPNPPEQTPAEHLWDLHDRGFIDDAEYAKALKELDP